MTALRRRNGYESLQIEFMFYDNSRLQLIVKLMGEADGRSVSETKT